MPDFFKSDPEIIMIGGGTDIGAASCANWLSVFLSDPGKNPWIIRGEQVLISDSRDQYLTPPEISRATARFLGEGRNIILVLSPEIPLFEDNTQHAEFRSAIGNVLGDRLVKISSFWLTASEVARRHKLGVYGPQQLVLGRPDYLQMIASREERLASYVTKIDVSDLNAEQASRQMLKFHAQNLSLPVSRWG
jgi:hypothetical protein